ncbi:MAG: ABC transporter permease [Catonella sp.]|uniref:ABC transporter permease n=1 Tax=Catonella sp. TaxID=2382125 RepID=UPI003FA029EE
MKIKNIIKLSLIQTKLALIKLKSALFLLILMALIIALCVIWWKKTDMAKPKVLIANEENSMLANLTINSILNNKVAEIVNFVTIDYDEGKRQVDAGEALLLVYIKKGTINTLYEGKRAEINIYTKNENNDFTRLIISYIKGFTDIINVSQNAGLAYMDVMYERGMTEDERMKKFNELQSAYIKLTLARNSIFTGEDRVLGFDKKDIETGYYLLAAIFLIGITIGGLANSEILNKNMRQRLILSGISNVEIYLTVIAKILLANMMVLIIFINIAKTIGIGD